MRLGSSLEAEFNSGSVGNVLWSWVKSGRGCILVSVQGGNCAKNHDTSEPPKTAPCPISLDG